jgi:hypothetical protein
MNVITLDVKKNKKYTVYLASLSTVLLEEQIIHVVADTRIIALEFASKVSATKNYNKLIEAWEKYHKPLTVIACDDITTE